MEITPLPPRHLFTSLARVLVLVAVFAPVTLLALVPAMFGLERYVIADDSMAGSFDRGSVVFERTVPASDLRVGDVITFRPPVSSGVDALVTRRVVAIEAGQIQTQGDGAEASDPWVLEPGGATLPRAMFHVRWIGYPLSGSQDRSGWVVLLAAPAVFAALALADEATRRRRVAQEPRLL